MRSNQRRCAKRVRKEMRNGLTSKKSAGRIFVQKRAQNAIPGKYEFMSRKSIRGASALTIRASLLHHTRLVRLPNEPLLYLIGGNHAVQFKSAIAQMFVESDSVRKKREAFKAHVAEMIDKLHIEILAEEFSEEAKRQSDAQAFSEKVAAELGTAPVPLNWETVLEQLRKAKGIDEHRFCDPNSEERKALGIEDPDSERGRAQREQEWLSRIADCKHRRVLFVCGDNHYDAFAQLLESNGFNVRRGAHYDISDEEFRDL
jgi:hypothetical protein